MIYLNTSDQQAPPETNDAIATLTSDGVVQLSNGTDSNVTTALTPGTDSDGTVDEYRIDLSTITEGELYIGDPNGSGVLVDDTNNTIPASDLANLFFQADSDFTGNVEIQYVAIDNDGNEDSTPGVIYINTPDQVLPPETEDAVGRMGSNQVLQLSLPPTAGAPTTVTPLAQGSDPDGTVTNYRIDVSTITEGQLFIGNPTTGTLITGANNTITATNLPNLFFQSDSDFVGGVEIDYVAIDNDGNEDPTPGKIYITTATQNLPPENGRCHWHRRQQ